MAQTPNDPHSNPLSRVFSKIFHHDDAPKAASPSPRPHVAPPVRQATPAPAAPQAPHAAAPVTTPPAAQGTTAQATATTPVATPTSTQRTYTVRPGDSLSKIAQQLYGHADHWTLLFEANRGTVRDPDLIHPGQVLVVPDAPTLH